MHKCTFSQMYYIFKGTTWKRPEIQYIKSPSHQRLRAHHDLVYAVSIMECLLCDSEHTGFAESVCDHLSLYDGARALANRRQGQQQVFTLPDCRSLKACFLYLHSLRSHQLNKQTVILIKGQQTYTADYENS